MARLSKNLAAQTVVGNGEEMASAEEVKRELEAACGRLAKEAEAHGRERAVSMREIQQRVALRTREIARLAVLLSLTVAEEELKPRLEQGGKSFVRAGKPRSKWLSTVFGTILFFRTYLRAASFEADHSGIHPVDHAFGITRDRFSMDVVSPAARLATHVSFELCADLLGEFWGWSPAKDSIEEMLLGLGALAEEYWEQAPAPAGDGDVLIIQVDAKGAPMATEEELEKRRRPWSKEERAPSPRHRGRKRRKGWKKKTRRKPGDKSKNAKMANIVVMYTLKSQGDLLLGPLNKRVYGTFANKRRAFAFAAREAKKRGFDPGSEDSRIQFLSDGDPDLQDLADEFFPNAIQTLDLMHVLEYLWSAGQSRYRTGSKKLAAWMRVQKSRLLSGRHKRVVRELDDMVGTGPKAGRERVEKARDYLFNNLHRLDYKWAREMDLEIGTGAVEGAVKHVMGKRLDNGGMRWIPERAQATLQLRCIEISGQWRDFITFVEERTRRKFAAGTAVRLLRREPAPIVSAEPVETMRNAA